MPTVRLTGPRVVLFPAHHTADRAAQRAPGTWHAWTITVREVAIGQALLRIEPDDRTWATYSITIDQPQRRGRGYGTETTRLVIAHAFARLGVEVVQLTVAATNHRAQACYRACGFVAHLMGRAEGQNHLGMVCIRPGSRSAAAWPSLTPTLVLVASTRHVRLRRRECAFLGVGPGDQVAIETTEGGATIVTLAKEAA